MPSLKAQGSFWELRWKDCERQRSLPTSCFPGSCFYTLTAAGLVCMRSSQLKSWQGWERGTGWEKVSFLQGCCPWEATCALAGASAPVRMQAALSGLGGFRKGAHEVEKKSSGGTGRNCGMGGRLDQNFICM